MTEKIMQSLPVTNLTLPVSCKNNHHPGGRWLFFFNSIERDLNLLLLLLFPFHKRIFIIYFIINGAIECFYPGIAEDCFYCRPYFCIRVV